MKEQTLFVLLSLLVVTEIYASSSLPCRYAGVFPHPTDCTSMYTCDGSQNTRFKTKVYSCPRGQAFHKKAGRCVDNKLVPDCIQPIKPLASECENAALHCKDCSTLVFCELNGNGEYVNPTLINCESKDPTHPYCDSKTKSCTDILPPECHQQAGYKCTSPGFFPDTLSCDTYHICKDENNASDYVSDRCLEPPNLFYNSKDFQCSSVDPEGACEINCLGIIGILPHIDDRYYAFCSPVKDSKAVLYACPGNLRFDPDESECKFSCEYKKGLHAHIYDCKMFYRCPNDNDENYIEEGKCPDPLAFNPISGACEAQINVKCPTTSAPTTTDTTETSLFLS